MPIWPFVILYLEPLSCMWHCSLPDGPIDKMRKEDVEKEMTSDEQKEREKISRAIYPASSAPLIRRQEQGGKRGKHLPKTRSPAYTSVKTNLSSIIGLTNKLTGDDSR